MAGSGTDTRAIGRNVVFLGVVALVYMLYLVFSGQMGEFVSSLANANYGWVGVAMLCYVAYYVLGVAAYAIAVVGDPKSPLGLLDLMSVEGTGIFFSNLTPNGTGGAPAQILRLTRSGLSVGSAGALQYTLSFDEGHAAYFIGNEQIPVTRSGRRLQVELAAQIFIEYRLSISEGHLIMSDPHGMRMVFEKVEEDEELRKQ